MLTQRLHKPACPQDVVLLHTLCMSPSLSLSKVLASSYKQFDCMHSFFLLPKVWAIHLYLFIHLFSRKLMGERKAENKLCLVGEPTFLPPYLYLLIDIWLKEVIELNPLTKLNIHPKPELL